MTKIIKVLEKRLWESTCREFAEPFPIRSEEEIIPEDYDPAVHHPVFYGYLCAKVETYEDVIEEFDPAISHPACVGHVLIDIPTSHVEPKPAPAPNPKTCEPNEYLDYYIFPLLVPALTEALKQAKIENCFVRKKTKFNCSDFMTEYLYKNNPNYNDRQDITLWEIPFVKEWLKDHSRVPLPKSLLWSEEEASIVIQSFWRGYKVRCQPEIQELRRWQWDWKEENRGIRVRVKEFWSKKMPNYQDSEENISSTPNTEEAS